MQTFLPYADFARSASVLDYKRLGKQRVEAKQILNSLSTLSGWIHHPATKMWKGYENALIEYMNIIIKEWVKRGYKNTMKIEEVKDIIYPPWLDGPIHATHRSNLLRKDYEYYSKFGWEELDNLPYYWPQEKDNEF